MSGVRYRIYINNYCYTYYAMRTKICLLKITFACFNGQNKKKTNKKCKLKKYFLVSESFPKYIFQQNK